VIGPAAEPSPQQLTDETLGAMRSAGLAAAGVAAVERFDSTRRDLYERRDAGLHGGMAFTYRNPDRSTDPGRILEGARSLVVGAYGYLRRAPPPTGAPPAIPASVARYAWSDTYAALRDGLESGAAVLRRSGYRATVVADDNALVDREAARRAGIGWYGRNANLLLPGHGSWFVLGSVVTDAALRTSRPVEPACGSCTRCLSGCPTGAIVAPGVVDARRCLAWLLQATGPFPRQLRPVLGDRLYGCDDCQEVCPPNIGVAQRHPLPAADPTARATADAAMFLQDDDDAVVAAAGRWYVPRREARYLRRNALVVLGNTADAGDCRVVDLLEASLRHPDPLVRAHAVWACARLGRPELADALAATEADPMVREELDRLAEVPARGDG
jgi:epoxyqueuosine reductase